MIPEITGRDARYRSPLSPEECVERLRPALTRKDEVDFKTSDAEMLFVGGVDKHSLQILCRHRAKHKDSEFGLYARIFKDGSATMIRGRFRVPTATGRYMLFWFIGMAAYSIYIGVTRYVGPLVRMLLMAPPLVMIAIVVALSFAHRGRLKRDEDAISALLAERIDARRYRLKTPKERRRKR
ncbi:hypothetical protein ACFB49_20590 [Sphingomonas sp. DBB INV C78]|uniref:hypothetical protein n=1 Tax=Sphingomonas sp. DBB INV C78 TaxID=3349434 RepID=UPI0036D2CD96